MIKLSLKLLGATATVALLTTPALADDGDQNPYSVFEADQTQNSNVHSDVYLYIEDYSAEAVSNSIALGNSASGHVETGDIDVDIYQTLNGDVSATNEIYGGSAGYIVGTTTAYGNSASGGTWEGSNFYRAEQISHGDVEASTTVHAQNAYQLATGTTAIANVSAPSAELGEVRGFQSQESHGSVKAETDISMCCTGKDAVVFTTAGANAMSSEGLATTSFNGAVQITAKDETVQASTDVYMVDGHNVHAATTAFGNSATVHNKWGYATLGRDGSELYQENGSDIKAETYVTLDHWSGTTTATAYGLGNSALISNVGSDTGLYANQFNDGNVLATVDLDGQSWTGGAGIATATAIGNAATATLCNLCGDAAIQGSVQQVNNGHVTATASARTTHSGGTHVTATALGNSATFTSNGQ